MRHLYRHKKLFRLRYVDPGQRNDRIDPPLSPWIVRLRKMVNLVEYLFVMQSWMSFRLPLLQVICDCSVRVLFIL